MPASDFRGSGGCSARCPAPRCEMKPTYFISRRGDGYSRASDIDDILRPSTRGWTLRSHLGDFPIWLGTAGAHSLGRPFHASADNLFEWCEPIGPRDDVTILGVTIGAP
jgi:hypothetical protein